MDLRENVEPDPAGICFRELLFEVVAQATGFMTRTSLVGEVDVMTDLVEEDVIEHEVPILLQPPNYFKPGARFHESCAELHFAHKETREGTAFDVGIEPISERVLDRPESDPRTRLSVVILSVGSPSFLRRRVQTHGGQTFQISLGQA